MKGRWQTESKVNSCSLKELEKEVTFLPPNELGRCLESELRDDDEKREVGDVNDEELMESALLRDLKSLRPTLVTLEAIFGF